MFDLTIFLSILDDQIFNIVVFLMAYFINIIKQERMIKMKLIIAVKKAILILMALTLLQETFAITPVPIAARFNLLT